MHLLLPPPCLAAGADSLQTLLLSATPEARGLFFAEIGLEASPDEVMLWQPKDFVEVLVEFGSPGPFGKGDSIGVVLNGLPLHLLLPEG